MEKLFKETMLAVLVTGLAAFDKISGTELVQRYGKLFGKYADVEKLGQLLNNTGLGENGKVVQRAKELVFGKRALGENGGTMEPLCSIFSNLSINGTYPKQKMYYIPEGLTMEHVMPVPKSQIKGCNSGTVREQLFCEMDLLQKNPPEKFEDFMVVADTLMKKYLWGIPATQQEGEDSSLYDAVKAMLAITAALLKTESQDMPYIMAAGHFSGIQKYIFLVSKAGAGGVAKRLRSRSFYVNAMVSALAHGIVHKFGLPLLNILMLTGGKFYILLPHTEDAEQMLYKIEKSVTEFLYKKYRGNLSLELVWEKMGDEGIYHYSGAITRLSEAINKKKHQLLQTVLKEEGQWNPEKFIVYHDLLHKSMCASCRSALVDEGRELCCNCENDTEIGGKLPKIKQFSFSRGKGQYELLEGYYLNLDPDMAEPYLVMNMNNPDISGMYHRPVAISYAVNHVPVKDAGSRGQGKSFETKTFREIADESRGCRKLGILKADVDTLGFLFSEGLQREERNTGTIVRVNTLSRMLELFFNGYLHEIIAKDYKNVYCIFAGGDDLFLLGPWNEMPELAIKINKKFQEYTGFNPCITLSAAICMASGNGHISTIAEYCEEKLSQVKKNINPVVYPGRMGRNGVYFLNEAMSWEDFEIQVETGRDLSKACKAVGAAAMQRIGGYSRMYQDYHKNRDVDNLMFLPMFHYDIQRNYDTIKRDRWFENYCNTLYQEASYYQRLKKEVYFAEFSVKYAFYLTKEDRSCGL